MKRIIVIALIAMLVSTMLCGSVMAEAPNSGDGIPDGSGWDDIPPQDGEGDPNPDAESPGPAPSSGDGEPEGSGF